MTRQLTLLILLTLFSATLSATQVFPFKKYRVADGLSHNTANCAIQDSFGFLWIGTGNGLNRYDGYTNQVYRNSSKQPRSLGNNNVISLMENGTDIWVGTSNGIYIYNRQSDDFTHFDLRTQFDVIVSSEVSRMITTKTGRIWIATVGQGIFIYNPASEELKQSILPSSFSWDLCEGEDGTVYVSTLNKGLLIYDSTGTFITSRAVKAGRNGVTKINCLLHASDNGGLWIAVDNTLQYYRTQDETFADIASPSGSEILSLAEYPGNRLLIGTNEGLYIYYIPTCQWNRINSPAGTYALSSPSINDILIDREGTLWLMTNSGINYTPRQLLRFRATAIPSGNGRNYEGADDVNAICELPDGTIYIGSRHGLWKYNPGTGSFNEERLDGHHNIRCLMPDDDLLWIGTNGDGLILLNRLSGSIKRFMASEQTANALSDNNILSLGKGIDGNIYIGTESGLNVYSPKADLFWQNLIFSAMNPVTAILADSRGSIWIGTHNFGVFNQKGSDKWIHYQHNSGDSTSLAANSIVSLFEDRQGDVWIGTNGNGLSRYDNNHHFINSSEDNVTLHDKIVYSMAEDKSGILWIATGQGLLKLDRSNGSSRMYTTNDGLNEGQFIGGAALAASNGTIYFGSTGGLNMFSPGKITENSVIPPVYITGITFPDETHTPDLGTRPIYLRDELRLPYDNNSFTISFAALSMEDPSRNEYRYMLKGMDSKWTTTATDNTTQYTHLPAGEYEFMVMGTNNSGVWNDKPASIRIIISPPWWQSLWAYMAYILLIAAVIVYVIWRSNIYAKRKFRQRVEEFNLAKEKETYEAKISFFVNLVHEIRTPLSLICLPLEKLRENREMRDGKYIGMIDKNVNYLLNITNQLLDFQQMENGKLNLDLKPHTFGGLINDIDGQFRSVAALKGLTLTITHDDADDACAMADIDKVRTIIVNLMGNALKYAHSAICVTLSTDGATVSIAVADNGPGIPADHAGKIFDRFYRMPDHPEIKGTGIGLAYSRILAEAHGGTLTYADRPGGGALFTLTLPTTMEENDTSHIAGQMPVSYQDLTPEDNAGDQRPAILIVEDNTDLRNMMEESLNHWYTVTCACNGKEALELLDSMETEPEVIISDVSMPVMDGMELCRALKSDINRSHIPIILLTARTTLAAKTEGLENGAAVYIEKPFAIKQLHLQIENIRAMRHSFHSMIEDPENAGEEILPTEEFQFSPKDKEFVEKINAILSEQISDINFSVDSLAAGLNMSRSNFHRKIKAVTGMTPNRYMMNYRMGCAARFMEEGMRINEVAMQLGFTTSYFAKCFKARFGMLPKEYVKKITGIAEE